MTKQVILFIIHIMAPTKEKTVFTAEPEQLRQIREYVNSGRYQSASEFLREAIREKILRLRREHLAQQVARYCAEGDAGNDRALVDAQAFDDEEP